MQTAAKRLSAVTGESITEALVGMLIVALAFVMLCGAVVTAARVNMSIRVEDTSFEENTAADAKATANVSIVYADNTSVTVNENTAGFNVSGYISDKGGYAYYETN